MAMLYNITMARGESGRIVLEIDPSQKEDLYSALTRDGLTLKDWFLRQAAQYLCDKDQLLLFETPLVSEEQAPYKVKHESATVRAIEGFSSNKKVNSK